MAGYSKTVIKDSDESTNLFPVTSIDQIIKSGTDDTGATLFTYSNSQLGLSSGNVFDGTSIKDGTISESKISSSDVQEYELTEITDAQMDALDSKITANKVIKYEGYADKLGSYKITSVTISGDNINLTIEATS